MNFLISDFNHQESRRVISTKFHCYLSDYILIRVMKKNAFAYVKSKGADQLAPRRMQISAIVFRF